MLMGVMPREAGGCGGCGAGGRRERSDPDAD
jgi:hypothetical protein